MRTRRYPALFLTTLFFAVAAQAQTTAFNYQGRLTDGGVPANGAFQMQFKLFDALAAGSQIGTTIGDVAVTVSQGTFSLKLDFGANALSGANRWLEIAIRRNSGDSYVTLAPREQIASSPYAVRTLSAASADNALSLGGISASEYVTNTNLGNNVIRNQTTLQASSNFNISGNGFFGNRVGIGTTTPLHRLALSGGPSWTTHGWGGLLDLENASAIGWRANTGGTRFGMGHTNDGFFIFRTISELGTATTFPIYDLKMDNGGNIGVGSLALNTDVSQARMNIFNLSLGYGLVNTLGAVTVGSWVDATGGGYGTRSNHPLRFFTNNNAGSPQMTLGTNGTVGIGTSDPGSGLELKGTGLMPQQRITDSSSGNSLVMQGGAGGNMKVTGYNYGTNQAVPLYLSVDGANTIVGGNALQNRDKGGFIKAMLYVNTDGTILRCYNGITGSSAGNCGFTVNRFTAGGYGINFGFQIDDRFLSVTPQYFNPIGQTSVGSAAFILQTSTSVDVRTNTDGNNVSTEDCHFMIIVY